MDKLLEMLIRQGGKIISSNDCNPLEILDAQADHRMWVDKDGFGFIYLPPNIRLSYEKN